MSYSAQAWARAQQVGNSTAKYVLLELAYRHNKNDGRCFPSLKNLCDVLEIKKVDTLVKAIKYLEDKGFIRKVLKLTNEKWRNHYEFVGFVPSEWGCIAESPNSGVTPNSGVQKMESKKRSGPLQKMEMSTPKIGGGPLQKLGQERKVNKERKIKGKDNTREEIFVESSDSPKNLSDQKVIYEENRDIEEALSEIPFPESEFETTASVVGIEDSQEVTENAKGELTKAKKPRKTKKTAPEITKPEGVSPEVWRQWVALKKAKSKYMSQLMVTAIEREARKADLTTEKAMQCQLEHGWTGFKAEWVNNKQNSRPAWKRPSPFDDISHVDSWDEDLNS